MCEGCSENLYNKEMVEQILLDYQRDSNRILTEEEVFGEMQKIFNNDLVSRWYGAMPIMEFCNLLERMLEKRKD